MISCKLVRCNIFVDFHYLSGKTCLLVRRKEGCILVSAWLLLSYPVAIVVTIIKLNFFVVHTLCISWNKAAILFIWCKTQDSKLIQNPVHECTNMSHTRIMCAFKQARSDDQYVWLVPSMKCKYFEAIRICIRIHVLKYSYVVFTSTVHKNSNMHRNGSYYNKLSPVHVLKWTAQTAGCWVWSLDERHTKKP